jgi:polyisoprenoid-binding protein YceI
MTMKTLRYFVLHTVLAVALTFGTIATASAQTFVFDKNHTEIRFSWNHLGLSRMSGRFLVYDGVLNLDKAAPEKCTLNVKIDTSGLWTHVDKFNEHLKSADFFDVAKFPDIVFKSTKVERTGDKTAKLTGDLTIKGKTKPVTFDVTLNFDGAHPMSKKPTVAFSAKATVKRTDFDLGKYAPAVSDDVLIEIETEMNAKE